jgi:hypothetical protein
MQSPCLRFHLLEGISLTSTLLSSSVVLVGGMTYV